MAAVAVDVVEFCTCDRPSVEIIAKINIVSICPAGYCYGCGIGCSLAKVRLLDFPNLISPRWQAGKDVVALGVGEGGRFTAVDPVVVVEVEVDLPVGNWHITAVGPPVGVEVVVFVAADAADLEVADVDIADVYLASGSGGVAGFGHGVGGAQ